MQFWKEEKISLFSASHHRIFLRLWACIKKDLLKDFRLGWNISLHKSGQRFFVQMNQKCLLSTEWLWNVWSFSLLQSAKPICSTWTHISSDISFCPLHWLLLVQSLCAVITSACQAHQCHAVGASLLQLMSSDKDVFLSRVDMIVCSHADVTTLNDVAACSPSVSLYCCLVLHWITD